MESLNKMIPFERDIYLGLLETHLEKEQKELGTALSG